MGDRVSYGLVDRMPELVPTALYRRMAFRKINCLDDQLRGVVFKLAETIEERRDAIRLVSRMYARRGISTEDKARVSAFDLMPNVTVFVAKRGGNVIGSVSLVEDSPLGLPMEETHPAEVLHRRLTGRRFAEVGALAVAEGERRRGISLMLYVTLFRWARNGRYIEDLLIAVHPIMRKFYRDVLLFESIGPVQSYKKLRGALSAPLRLDLPSAIVRFREVYDNSAYILSGYGTFYKLFVQSELPGIQLPATSSDPRFLPIPQLSRDQPLELLKELEVGIDHLPERHRRLLTARFPILRTVELSHAL